MQALEIQGKDRTGAVRMHGVGSLFALLGLALGCVQNIMSRAWAKFTLLIETPTGESFYSLKNHLFIYFMCMRSDLPSSTYGCAPCVQA